jgi:hypothetical protein
MRNAAGSHASPGDRGFGVDSQVEAGTMPDPENPMTVYCFDGTGNHRNLLRPDGRIRRIDGGLGTNVAKLSEILDERVVYRGGVGNPIDFPYWAQASELAFSMGCKDLVDRAWPQIEAGLAEGDDIIDLIAYGRGASQAVELANRLADANRADGGRRRVRFCALIDPIWAAGLPGNNRDQVIRHELPTGLRIEYLIEALAWDEARLQLHCHWQQLDRADLDLGSHEQRVFRGVHGDVGGGYATTGLSDVVLRWMIEHATRAGLAFQPEATWQVCGEPLRLAPDPSQLPHRVTDLDFFSKPRRFPPVLVDQAREHGLPLGAWHRVIVRNRGQREKYLMNLDPFIEDIPRSPGNRIVDPRSWFPKRPRPDSRMRIERALSDEEILALILPEEG